MDGNSTSTAVELTKAIGAIVGDLKWPFVAALFLYFARGGVSAFVRRLVNLDFRWGEVQGSLKAEPCPADAPSVPAPVQADKPADREDQLERSESKSIEEEKKSDWFETMYRSFMEGRFKEAKEAFEKHQITVTDERERTRCRAIYLHLDYTRNGSQESLVQLQRLFAEVADPDLKADVAFWLGWSYSRTRDYEAELGLWQAMIDSAKDDQKRANFTVNAATAFIAMQRRAEARNLLLAFLRETADLKALKPAYNALAELENKEGDQLIAAIAYEKVAQFTPQDTDVLFSAAYAQSHCNLAHLSYVNYDTILGLKPDADMATNNMGVQASALGMEARSVEYYRRAAELGNTLAMANLAQLYLSSGFLKESEDIVRQAMTKDDPHPNVASALADIEKRKKSEADAREKALAIGTQQREFVRSYADARFSRSLDPEDLTGVWVSERGVAVNFARNSLSLAGGWEESDGGLFGGKEACKLEATIVNASLHGRFERKPQESSSLLAYKPTRNRSFLAFVTPDGSELRLMFRDKEPDIFYVFFRSKASDCPGPTNG